MDNIVFSGSSELTMKPEQTFVSGTVSGFFSAFSVILVFVVSEMQENIYAFIWGIGLSAIKCLYF